MSLISQAKEILLKKRQRALQNAFISYENAQNIDEVKQIQQKINALLPQIAKLEATGKTDQTLEKNYDTALKERDALYKKYNIDKKHFSPQFSCSSCGDSGYIDGKLCICLKQTVNKIITEQYGIDTDTFSNYTDKKLTSDTVFKQMLEDKYDIMKKYCNAFPSTKYSTHLLIGASGTGKTYISCYVANKIIQQGYSVIFATAFKLNKIFLKYHIDFNNQYDDYIENLYDCDLLVIDDLGTENCYKNVTNEYLLSLISERLSGNKHTLITTNLNRGDIREKYSERLYSRLLDKNKTFVIQFNGIDLRQ